MSIFLFRRARRVCLCTVSSSTRLCALCTNAIIRKNAELTVLDSSFPHYPHSALFARRMCPLVFSSRLDLPPLQCLSHLHLHDPQGIQHGSYALHSCASDTKRHECQAASSKRLRYSSISAPLSSSARFYTCPLYTACLPAAVPSDLYSS